MKIFFFVGLLFMMLICLFGCRSNATQPIEQPIRNLTQLEKTVVSSTESFGINIFKQINQSEKDKNIFISPFSISTAFGMALNGANGTTYDEIQNTLSLSGLSRQQVNETYKNLNSFLLSIDKKVDFRIANSIWYRNNFVVKEDFINTNVKYFDAEVSGLDFNNPSAAGTINSWVNQSTNGKIQEIVQNPIDPATLMFVINAIYFKAAWKYSFDKQYRADDIFRLSDGSTTTLKFMKQETELGYTSNDKLQAVELPYSDGNYSMIVLLPNTGQNIDNLISGLSSAEIDQTFNSFAKTKILLSLPRFTFKCEYTLNDVLKLMGIRSAFSRAADFSGIFEGESVCISEVKHKTFLEVNEEGTEAAAVTSISFERTSTGGGNGILQLNVNKPFLFLIRENNSNCILFIGKVLNPTLN